MFAEWQAFHPHDSARTKKRFRVRESGSAKCYAPANQDRHTYETGRLDAQINPASLKFTERVRV